MSAVRPTELIVTLREFEDQVHDWIVVQSQSPAEKADLRRSTIFRLLEDKGWVTLANSRDFKQLGELPTDDRGRRITAEQTFRVTALGREQLKPWYWRSLGNVWQNLPTFAASVLTALAIAWLMKLMGLNQ